MSLMILYDLRREMRKAVLEIRAANDYDTACALWKTAYDLISSLRDNNILSLTSFQIYSDMLDHAIID